MRAVGRRTPGQRARPRAGRGQGPGGTRSSRSSRAASAESATPGVGLGLAICRAIVEAHRGRIWVEPTHPQGATFTFSLPLGTPPAVDLADDGPADRRASRSPDVHPDAHRPGARRRARDPAVRAHLARGGRLAGGRGRHHQAGPGRGRHAAARPGHRRPRPARRRRRRLHPRGAHLVGRADHRAVGAHPREREGGGTGCRCRRLHHQALRRGRAAGAHARQPAPRAGRPRGAGFHRSASATSRSTWPRAS